MNSENNIITHFLTYLSENDNNETRQYTKQRLQQAYTTFSKTEAENFDKQLISFATLQLHLKDEGKIISEGRDTLRVFSGFGEPSSLTPPIVDATLFSKTSIPEFATDTKFFLLEVESFEDVKESTEVGRLIVQSEHVCTLNEAFKSSEQVVLLVCVRYGNRFRGFCTMDGLVSKVEDLKNEWSSATLKADDMYCPVSWEKLGDHPIPLDTAFGTKMDVLKARNSCQAFFFERQPSIGEFKSPESALDVNTVYSEEQSKLTTESVSSIPSMSPLLQAFSRCKEETSEAGEEFRRRSIDKLAAAAHYEMPPRKTGVVVKFSQQKGYGFIRPDFDYIHGRQLPDIFVHRTSIVSSNKVPNLRVGQKTEYDVTLDPRTGKPHAVNVTGPNRIPLDEMKMPIPPILERPPLYGHGSRNVKSGKVWNENHGNIRKPMMNIPQQVNSAPASNQNIYSKQNAAWKNPGGYQDNQRNTKWESEKNNSRFLPKEMNMTVTIDNEPLPSNVSRYQHRQSPSPRTNQTWGQPQFSNDYRGPYDTHHQQGSTQGGARTLWADTHARVTSPAREMGPNDYDNYGRREYWRYDQERPQYDGDYRYDYRYQQDYRPQQNW